MVWLSPWPKRSGCHPGLNGRAVILIVVIVHTSLLLYASGGISPEHDTLLTVGGGVFTQILAAFLYVELNVLFDCGLAFLDSIVRTHGEYSHILQGYLHG